MKVRGAEQAPLLSDALTKTHRFAKMSWDKTRKFSTVALAIVLLVLDIVFLIGKTSSAVSEHTTISCYTALSFAGLMGLPFWIDRFIKTGQDARIAYINQDTRSLVVSTLRAIDGISSTLLSALGITAALYQQVGRPGTMKAIFAVTIPWGVASVALDYLATLVTLLSDAQLLAEVKRRSFSDHEFKVITLAMRGQEPEFYPSQAVDMPKLKLLGSRWRVGMDKDTLRLLLSLDPTTQGPELQKVLQDNLRTQVRYTQGGRLALSLVDTGLLVASKRHPNSAVGAIVDLVAAVLSLARLGLDKCLEARQRTTIRLQVEPQAQPAV